MTSKKTTKNAYRVYLFGYNTKELQDQTGYYDYGFRQYEPQLGRWHVVDAMAENYFSTSPYAYTRNDPVNRIDVMGLWDYDDNDYEDYDNAGDDDGIPPPDIPEVIIYAQDMRYYDMLQEISDPEDWNDYYGRDGDPPDGGGNADNYEKGRGHIISMVNATAAYGLGGTIDIGGVVDDYGNSNLYFTIGITTGYGASAGMGYLRTNKGFKNSDLAGQGANANIQLIGPLSFDISGNWKYGGNWPGANTYTIGGNIGVGRGYFINHTYTILAPVPSGEQVWQMVRHWH